VSDAAATIEHMFDAILARLWKWRRQRQYPPRRGAGPLPAALVNEPSSLLGKGIYTVPETVRILRPTLTRRKVHYWLDEGLLAEPIRWGTRGVPTLLTYQQVLRIRVLQRLRDDLGFSLKKSRDALRWIVEHVTADEWHKLTFFRTGAGQVGITDGHEAYGVPGDQALLEGILPELEQFLQDTRDAWERRVLPIGDFKLVVSDPRVMAGSPIIVGTRVETSFIAHLSEEVGLRDLRKMYPHAPEGGIEQAAEFEGVQLAA
jgi:DNA-binding transcriptional MerR regulator/uncharacterized protein (DUF433 family)